MVEKKEVSAQNAKKVFEKVFDEDIDPVVYIEENGLKIVEDPEAFESEEYAIAVKKGNTALLDVINKAIDSMLADGTISDLAVKYTEADAE